MTFGQFITLLRHCFDTSYLTFNNQFYKQIFSLRMGNCLSPICADIVMAHLQNMCISKLQFRLPFFKCYVDIITCIPRGKLQNTIDIFSSYNINLLFTTKIKKINQNLFLMSYLLELKIVTLISDWHEKPTYSERLLNFHSQHTVKQ